MMMDNNSKFIVYKASAGSGKTYTLVKEYLKLVLPQPDKFSRILAVTFTNKAAYEMKSRVIEYLVVLSQLNPAGGSAWDATAEKKYRSLVSNLILDTGLTELQLGERATLVLEKILHNYSDFAICTIDSFVQRIIRTFAFDMKIPHNFEVELDTNKILSQAVDLILSYAGISDEITEVLVDFIKTKIAEDKNWDIENDLKDFSKEILKEDTEKYIGLFHNFSLKDFKSIYRKLYSQLENMNKTALEKALEVMNAMDACGLSSSSFYRGKNGIYNFFLKVKKGKGLANAGTNSYHFATINDNKWYSVSASDGDKQSIDGLKPKIKEGFHLIADMIKPYHDILVISQSIFPLTLLNLIEEEVEALKTEENIIFISDFYRKIHEQLLNEPVPFIFQRTGERFEHFFIDEFQDTSILQFQNMLPLIDNSIAQGNFNFIVGDGKQAIYRWRSGEVRQFSSLPNIFQKPEALHFDEIEKSLNRSFCGYEDYNPDTKLINYRSRKQIVDFNNELFEYLNQKIQNPEYQNIYSGLAQQSKPGNEGGYVCLNFVDVVEDYQENQLLAVLNIVRQLIVEQVPLRNIAIICRKNKEASAIAVRLLSESIDVVSSESLLLSSSAKVNFLVSLLRVMHNPMDNLSVSTVLIYFHQHFVNDMALHGFLETYRLASQNKSVWKSLENLLKQYHVNLNFNTLTTYSLFDLNEELMRIFGLNQAADPFVIFYLEAVNEFVAKRSADVAGFLDWWDEYGIRKSITVPDQLNAVKVMTIHKSKGQEFPVVIYPFADEDDKVKPNTLVWVENKDKNNNSMPAVPVQLSKNHLAGSSYEYMYENEKAKVILDLLNLCYVALTRAEERLYVLSKDKEMPNFNTFGGLLIEFLKSKKLWNASKKMYEFGEIPPVKLPEKNGDAESRNASLNTLTSANWFNRVLIKPESAMIWDENMMENSLLWGNMIHKVLSEMNTADDAENAVANQVAQGFLSSEDAGKVSLYIYNMMAREDIREFFAAGQKTVTEIEIITPDNKVYRPDRIVFKDDKPVIIDFKTGKEDKKHQEQVQNYGKLIEEITGKATLQVLIYLQEKPKVVLV